MSSRPPARQLGAGQAATPDATPPGHGGGHPTPAGEEVSAIRRRQADLLARRAEADRQLDEAEQELAEARQRAVAEELELGAGVQRVAAEVTPELRRDFDAFYAMGASRLVAAVVEAGYRANAAEVILGAFHAVEDIACDLPPAEEDWVDLEDLASGALDATDVLAQALAPGGISAGLAQELERWRVLPPASGGELPVGLQPSAAAILAAHRSDQRESLAEYGRRAGAAIRLQAAARGRHGRRHVTDLTSRRHMTRLYGAIYSLSHRTSRIKMGPASGLSMLLIL
jgi:hypothetical protein